MSTINFDSEKNGYNKEQVRKYFELVQKEYEKMYSENQDLRAQLQQARQLADSRIVYDIPPDRMEAIALALVDAESEAQRIVNTAREKAWQIITDAKKGLPVAEESASASLPAAEEGAKPSLPTPSVETEEASVHQPQEPSAAPAPKSTMDDMDGIDELIESILSRSRSGGD